MLELCVFHRHRHRRRETSSEAMGASFSQPALGTLTQLANLISLTVQDRRPISCPRLTQRPAHPPQQIMGKGPSAHSAPCSAAHRLFAVHGSLARAGKVKSQTPKVDKQEKKKTPKGRAKKRILYNRRCVSLSSLELTNRSPSLQIRERHDAPWWQAEDVSRSLFLQTPCCTLALAIAPAPRMIPTIA